MGKKVALIERGRMGGTCLNVGCIPAKTFLRSSKLFHECGEAAKFGVRLGSVEFDMPAVIERKNRVVGTLTKGVEGMLKRAGVEVIAGQARLVSRNVVEVGTARHGFRSHACPGESRHHRRRLYRPRVRLLLQRSGRQGQCL
jgi:dihydrolipoamide dehydrogenase